MSTMRVIKLSDVKPVSIGAGAGAGAGVDLGARGGMGGSFCPDFGMDDFLQQQITATYMSLETASKEIEIKQQHLENLKARFEALEKSIDVEPDAETKAALQKDAEELQAAITKVGEHLAADETARQHLRTQIAWLNEQQAQERAMRPTVWPTAAAGAGAAGGASASALPGYSCGNRGCGTRCCAGAAGARPTTAPTTSLYEDLSYLQVPMAYQGDGKKAAANTVVEPPVELLEMPEDTRAPFLSPLIASMKGGAGAGAGAGAKAGAEDVFALEEVDDVGDDCPEPWDEPETELGPFSKYVEGRLRELLQEIQQQRIKEPDATTWLYHLSGAIESAKLDLSS